MAQLVLSNTILCFYLDLSLFFKKERRKNLSCQIQNITWPFDKHTKMVLYRYYVPLHPQENTFSPQTKTYVMYVWLPSITKHVYIEALNHSQARYSVTIQLHFKMLYIFLSFFCNLILIEKSNHKVVLLLS